MSCQLSERGVHRDPGRTQDSLDACVANCCAVKKELPMAFNLNCVFLNVSIYFSWNKATTILSLVCNLSLLGKKRKNKGKVTEPHEDDLLKMESLVFT